jgi:hypothetical protein
LWLLPVLDRKIELTCHPIGVKCADLFWMYIDTIREEGQKTCRFVTISSQMGKTIGLIEVNLVHQSWIWGVYLDGATLSANGKAEDLAEAMNAGAMALAGLTSGWPKGSRRDAE